LASAFVIANFVDTSATVMELHTMSGVLTVTKKAELYEMDFPSWTPTRVEVVPLMAEALGVPVLEAHLSRDMLLLVEDEQIVRDLRPNLSLLAEIPGCFAAIVTAKGDHSVDFVSRFFAPNAGIPEDPVTGSSHSTLIPFWAERLGKSKMTAKQLSKRGGTLFCENMGERVKIAGTAALYLKGEILSC
jgi:predicted PhzF superfamily epimerase YddE/YHI9